MNIRMIAMTALVAFASFAVSTAGMKCDEKATAKKAKSSSSCCTSTSASVKKVSNKECSVADEAACSTTAVKAKKTSNSSCCSMKAKDVKSAAVTPATETAVVTPSTTVK